MHGAVNQAVEDLVKIHFGDGIWNKIKAKSGFTEEMFLSNEPYPDQLTYDLVVATHEVTGMAPADILRALGEHWILDTGLTLFRLNLKSKRSAKMNYYYTTGHKGTA